MCRKIYWAFCTKWHHRSPQEYFYIQTMKWFLNPHFRCKVNICQYIVLQIKFFSNYVCVANAKSEAQFVSEVDVLLFISLLSATAWHLQKHIAVLGLEFLFFQWKYNGHSAHFLLLLYTVNTWDECTFHGIAPNHSWCPRTKFLTDWYLSASKILALNYNSFFKTQILKPADTVLIWGKRSITKTAIFFCFEWKWFFRNYFTQTFLL
jgi:hypothetical protein